MSDPMLQNPVEWLDFASIRARWRNVVCQVWGGGVDGRGAPAVRE